MLVPNEVWTLVELFLIVYILYVIQRIVFNAQTMSRQAKLHNLGKKYFDIVLKGMCVGLSKSLADIGKDSKKETTSEDKKEDSDSINIDDLLS